MPMLANPLLIEGSFEELADELALYIDDLKKKSSEDAASIRAEIAKLLEQGQKDETLRKLATASAVLNSAPERGTTLVAKRSFVTIH